MHNFVAQNPFRIDHKQTAQRDAAVFDQNAIIARDGLRRIGCEWVLQVRHAAFVAGRPDPGAVRKYRVRGYADDVRANTFEIFIAIAEGGYLGGTNKSEIERVKQKYQPL